MADIAIIQRFLPPTSPGGVGHFTDGLARVLSRRGHRVTVVSQDPGPADAPYTVERVAMPVSRLAPLRFPWALRAVDFGRFDVIHAQGDEQWIRRRGCPPVVRTMHGTALAEAWFNGVIGRSPKRAAMHLWFYVNEWVAAVRSDALVGVSASTLTWYPRRGTVIPNGINVAALRPDGTPKSAYPSVLFVGQVDSRKRGRLLIAAMQEVRAQVPEARLWIVGADRPGSIQAPGVDVLGPVADAELRQRLREAWVMCLPSAYEGFGRPYVEAMAAGTTVVATPNPGAREVLDGGRCGVIVDDHALADALVRVLTSSEDRARYVAAGLAQAARYDWDVVAGAYEQVYAQVLERR